MGKNRVSQTSHLGIELLFIVGIVFCVGFLLTATSLAAELNGVTLEWAELSFSQSKVDIYQLGSSNAVIAAQYGYDHLLFGAQAGDGNALAVSQRYLANASYTLQFGRSNWVYQDQSGVGNGSYAVQYGRENRILHWQTGAGNGSTFRQFGNYNTIVQWQMGFSEISVEQRGSGLLMQIN